MVRASRLRPARRRPCSAAVSNRTPALTSVSVRAAATDDLSIAPRRQRSKRFGCRWRIRPTRCRACAIGSRGGGSVTITSSTSNGRIEPGAGPSTVWIACRRGGGGRTSGALGIHACTRRTGRSRRCRRCSSTSAAPPPSASWETCWAMPPTASCSTPFTVIAGIFAASATSATAIGMLMWRHRHSGSAPTRTAAASGAVAAAVAADAPPWA